MPVPQENLSFVEQARCLFKTTLFTREFYRMKIAVKKSDFVLTPYMKSNDLRGTYQILNTVVPYLLLWFLAVKAAAISLWLLPPIIVLMTLFSIRCFSLMHDCGHYSLFSSKKVNRIVGFMLGLINAIPQYPCLLYTSPSPRDV
jgi:omega-6 fatty acid desaturase (delta-12 desaturase)